MIKKAASRLMFAGLLVVAQAGFAQKVTLANVALGMNESEVKAALAPSAPYYVRRASEFTGLDYLIAESEEESFAFTLVDGRVVAFSLMHVLPAGQQPYLPAGQEPTVSTLRNLIVRARGRRQGSIKATHGG